MHILSVSTALPPHHYQQHELATLLDGLWASRPAARKHLLKLHKSVEVQERYLALPAAAYPELTDFTEANAAFNRVGSDLAAEALEKAVMSAGVHLQDIDAIFFTTVTGVGVPTIDAHLINRLRLRPDIKRIPMFGLGCLAGAAGVARLHDYLKAYPNQVAALVAVELCSLTLQQDDASIANLIASGLFGDGAAAVVACGSERTASIPNASQPRLVVESSRSSFYYDSESVMGWDIGSNGFKLILSAQVPAMVKDHLVADVTRFLQDHRLSLKEVGSWICHPGGPKVLEAMEQGFGLQQDELGLTWASLRAVGNLSSASVLFVLADTLKQRPRPAGTPALMIAMGPGFCAEMVLLSWKS